MNHNAKHTQATLQEDLLKIGAEHTRFGLGVGIFVSLLFIGIGLFCLFAALVAFTNGFSQQEPATAFGVLTIGVIVTLFGAILCVRQVKMRDQLANALNQHGK